MKGWSLAQAREAGLPFSLSSLRRSVILVMSMRLGRVPLPCTVPNSPSSVETEFIEKRRKFLRVLGLCWGTKALLKKEIQSLDDLVTLHLY